MEELLKKLSTEDLKMICNNIGNLRKELDNRILEEYKKIEKYDNDTCFACLHFKHNIKLYRIISRTDEYYTVETIELESNGYMEITVDDCFGFDDFEEECYEISLSKYTEMKDLVEAYIKESDDKHNRFYNNFINLLK